jgi:hypothetical protein
MCFAVRVKLTDVISLNIEKTFNSVTIDMTGDDNGYDNSKKMRRINDKFNAYLNSCKLRTFYFVIMILALCPSNLCNAICKYSCPVH